MDDHSPLPRPGPPKRDVLGVKQESMSFLAIKAQSLFLFDICAAGAEWRQVPFTGAGGACWRPLPCLVRHPLTYVVSDARASLGAQTVKSLPAVWETQV